MERPRLGDHRLRNLKPLPRHLEPVTHRPPHRIVALLDPDIVSEKRLPLRRRPVEQHLHRLAREVPILAKQTKASRSNAEDAD